MTTLHPELPTEGGSYVLLINLPCPAVIQVGRLGEFNLPSGRYLYVGSALGGIRGRVNRHLWLGKQTRWHIDYLNSPDTGAAITQIWWQTGDERQECEWASALGRSNGTSPLATSFGSSDCRCTSHLFHAKKTPDPEALGLGPGVQVSDVLDKAD